MTIRVPLEKIPEHIEYFASRGASAILTIANSHGQCRIFVCDPVSHGECVVLPGVPENHRKISQINPEATIVFPAVEHHGYTFIIDGQVQAGTAYTMKPMSAMLHRPVAHADGPEWEEL